MRIRKNFMTIILITHGSAYFSCISSKLISSQEYYKVTGRFYYQKLPHSDVRVILFLLVLLFSALWPAIQYQKWQSAVKYLQLASAQNLPLKAGGTKQTLELYRRAVERYEAQLNATEGTAGSESSKQKSKASNTKAVKLPSKLSEDPQFLKIIDEVRLFPLPPF
jgi:hypothetical protein